MRLHAISTLTLAMSACAGAQALRTPPPAAAVRELPTLRQAEHADGQPAIVLPAPGGPYRVGRMSFHATDSSRAEGFTADSSDRREVVFHVWYPSSATGGTRASFMEVSPDDSVYRRSYSFMGVELIPRVRAHSLVDVPLSDASRAWPVLIFSHGLGGISRLYTTFQENLASHGYVVVGIDHPYLSAAFTLPSGTVVRNLSRPANRQRDVIVQALDIVFVANMLEQIHAGRTPSRLAGRLDLKRLGVFGQSRGGFAAPHACYLDRRFKACANLDGWELTPEVMTQGITQPYLHIEESAPWDPPPTDSELVRAGQTRPEANAEMAREKASRETLFAHMPGGAYLMTTTGAIHASFSDQPIIAPNRYPGVKQPFARTLEICDAYLLAFFDKYLRNKPAPLLAPGRPPFPEVTLEIREPSKPPQIFRGTP